MKTINLSKKIAFTFSFMAMVACNVSAADYAIVVNSANSSSLSNKDSKTLIKRMYLKETTVWADGTKVVPFSPESGSANDEAFLGGILNMTPAENENYWMKRKQTDGETSPREIGATRILLRQIKRKEGAFGVISNDEIKGLPEGVKVLVEF